MLNRLTAPWLDRSNYPLDWNGTARATEPFGAHRPVFECFRHVACQHPSRVAIDDGTVRLSYAQVLDRATALAHRVADETAPDDLVGILLPSCADFTIAMLACLAAGRLFVPLDSHYPQAWLAGVAADCGMAAVISRFDDPEIAGLIPPTARRIALEGAAAQGTLVPRGLGDPAFVLFTSGSTGKPKGMVNSQHALLQRVAQYADAAHVDETDRFLPLSSECTIAGLRERFTALLTGATLHLIDVQRAGARAILSRLEGGRITMIYAVPALLRAMMQLGPKAPQTLRNVRVGGEAVLWSDVDALRDWLPQGCRIQLGYSSTEAPIMQWFVPPDFPREGSKVPLGYPIAGNALAIVDEDGHAATPGEAGELVVRSPYVALGRWRRGAIDASDFPADPNDPACRTHRTGDLVRLRADGLIDIVGRKDRQLKIRGVRVEPGELEAAIRGMPGVRDAAVFPRPVNEQWWLIGYVAGDADLANLKLQLRDAVPPALQPQKLHRLETIPRLASGKLDMSALRTLDEDCQRREGETVSPVAAPVGKTEEAIAAIWSRVLQRDAGRDEDFFDCGGDSLGVLSLMFGIEEALGLELPVTMIYDAPTVARMAAAIDNRDAAKFSPLVRIRAGEGAPLFIVHGVGGNVMELFAAGRRIAGTRPVYALQARGLDGKEAPSRSITAMAQDYLGAVREVYPQGPWHFAGYSSGGLIAFEMARHAAPLSLTLIDTQTNRRQWPLHLWAAHFIGRAKHHVETLSALPTRARLRYAGEAASSFARGIGWRLGFGKPELAPPADLPPVLQAVADATYAAVADYAPRRYDGAVNLLLADEADPHYVSLPAIWKSRCASLTVASVPGHHRSMVQGENAAHLADALSRIMRTASGA
ncbi:MAG TPA: AMP-binding protein [Rhizomicrobium sp.]|nr:AMP-binding protein [Rhizomicrobium sp.]